MSRPKIVIIEDDESLVKLMSNVLDDKYEISIVSTGEGALSQIGQIQPVLVILDILLPGKSGFEFLEELKSDQSTKGIPVIILSNLGLDDEIRKGVSMGAVDYIVKADTSIDEILKKINKILKK